MRDWITRNQAGIRFIPGVGAEIAAGTLFACAYACCPCAMLVGVLKFGTSALPPPNPVGVSSGLFKRFSTLVTFPPAPAFPKSSRSPRAFPNHAGGRCTGLAGLACLSSIRNTGMSISLWLLLPITTMSRILIRYFTSLILNRTRQVVDVHNILTYTQTRSLP